MDLTKLEHACMILEKDGQRLVIDPGTFTRTVEAPGLVAIVITHRHPDHWTPEQLRGLLEANPDARVFGPAGVADAAEDFEIETVQPGGTVDVGAFHLSFFGGEHAVIHSSIPRIDNVGVIVDDGTFAYAGDSFALPGRDIDVLAAPAGAPWMKIAESMDYVLEVAPRRALAAHEAVLSEPGRAMSRERLTWAVEQGGGTFLPLAPGDTVTV